MRLNRPYASSHITPRVRPALFQSTGVDQSEAYNQEMKKAMGWDDADPYQYHYDRGLYYHEVMPNLLCGSQPRNVEDIVKLKEDIGASVIINVGTLYTYLSSHVVPYFMCSPFNHHYFSALTFWLCN